MPSTNATVSFSCRYCAIKDFDSSIFIDVPHIQDLDLSWNEITGDVLTGETFRGPYQLNSYQPLDLERIDLSHNKISSLNGQVLEHSPKLFYLNLDYNNIDDLNSFLAALKVATQLSELHLSWNQVKSVSKELFMTLKNMKALYLEGNFLTVIPADLGLIGTSLQILNLANNSLVELNEPSFMGMKAIESLDLSRNKDLKTIRKSTFSKMGNLKEINLSHNRKLVDLDLTGFVTLKNLRKVSIKNKLKNPIQNSKISDRLVFLQSGHINLR